MNKQHLFFTDLKAGKSKIKVPADSVSGDLLVHRGPSSHCVLTCRWDEGLSQVSFTRALIPFKKALCSGPNLLPKASPPATVTLEVRISTHQFWRSTDLPNRVFCSWSPKSHGLFSCKICPSHFNRPKILNSFQNQKSKVHILMYIPSKSDMGKTEYTIHSEANRFLSTCEIKHMCF